MNLALQKRHEQLERWRQNEANVEQIERQRQDELQKQKQQQQQQEAQRQPSKSPLRSPTVQRTTANRSIRNSKNKSISVSLESESGADHHYPSSNHTNTRTSSASVQNASSSSSSSRGTRRGQITSNSSPSPSFIDESEQQQQQHARVKFTQSTLFLNACAQGDLEECKRMLGAKLVDIDTTTCDGLTGLHEAAICGNSQLVEFLLSQGANINCCDHEGWTPLHAAASLGQAEIVALLLERHADVTIINCENFLAYDLARTDEVRLLISQYMQEYDIDTLRRQEELLIESDLDRWLVQGKYEERSHPITRATVLHVLAAKGYVKLMKRLLEANKRELKRQVNLEARDSEGFTPLLAASFWNQTEIVELLIEHGANILAQANSGYKISSIHLKNYQDSKFQQQQTTPQERTTTTRSSRSSLGSSLESDIGQQQTSSISQQSTDYTTRNRSTASLDSSGDNESVGDNIPSASARHLRSQQQQQQQQSLGQLSKSKSLEITSSSQQDQENESSSLLYSSMSVDRLLLRADSMGERDLRKSFKELVVENERLKQQMKGFDDKDKQRQQDWIRKERQLHRKISELEEENKQIEQWKMEIQRLKDENNSLIRVVSKLTKQNH